MRKPVKGEKLQSIRISTSSFEIGHLSPITEEPKAIVSKKHSICGLRLPSTMRLPWMRGSTASSLNLNAVSSPTQTNPGTATSVPITIYVRVRWRTRKVILVADSGENRVRFAYLDEGAWAEDRLILDVEAGRNQTVFELHHNEDEMSMIRKPKTY